MFGMGWDGMAPNRDFVKKAQIIVAAEPSQTLWNRTTKSKRESKLVVCIPHNLQHNDDRCENMATDNKREQTWSFHI